MNKVDLHREMSCSDVLTDIFTSLALISGAWLVQATGDFFFPAGLPYLYSLILVARDVATVLWVVGTTARYLKFAYHEINAAVQFIIKSWLWRRGEQVMLMGKQSLWLKWLQLDHSTQQIALLILVVILSLLTFWFSHSAVDLIMPSMYWGTSLGLSFILEYLNRGKQKPTIIYWMTTILLLITLGLLLATLSLPSIIDNREAVPRADQVRLLLILSLGCLLLEKFDHGNGRKWIRTVKAKWQTWIGGAYEPPGLQSCLAKP